MSEARFVNSAYSSLTAADLELGLLSIFTCRTDDLCFSCFFLFLWWYRKIKTMVNKQVHKLPSTIWTRRPCLAFFISKILHGSISSWSYNQELILSDVFPLIQTLKNNRRFHFLFYLLTSSLIYSHIYIFHWYLQKRRTGLLNENLKQI